MRIRRILQISTGASVVSLLLVAAAFASLQVTDRRHEAATTNMNAAVRKISLIRGFLPELTGASNRRAALQWQRQFAELNPILMKLPALDPAARSLKARILEDQITIGALFANLTAEEQGVAAKERQQIIGGQLDVRTASMVSDVLALNDMTVVQIKRQRQWILAAMAASIAGLVVVIAGLLRILQRRIVAPILRLEEATAMFSAGKLDRPVLIAGSDEITTLAAGFEYMRVSLRDRLAALRQAEAEARAAYQQLRETHEQMVQMEKLSALGTLVGGVAHEINNPLMGIKGYIEFATDRLAAGRPKEMLQRASLEVDRIGRIVKNMLVFARSKSTLLADEVNLVQAVRNTVSLVETDLRHQAIELRIVSPEGPVLARCNLDNIQQAVLNLILNARDALKERHPPRKIDVTVAAEEERCTITVADNGSGVPEAVRGKIFDPFFTTKPVGQGTGLGLAVSRQLVEASGGKLEVTTAPGGGASFVLTVNAAEKVQA